MAEREAEKKNNVHLEKLKANGDSVTEEQRRERLRIRHEKDRAKKQLQEQEGKVVSNRRQRESAPGHSQKIEER